MSRAIDVPPARRPQPQRQPRREESTSPTFEGPTLIIPPADVGGIEIGVEITPDTVIITAQPPAGEDEEAPSGLVEIPIIAPPPPAPTEEEGEQPFARSEEHTSEPHSLMRLSYAVFCLNK